MKKIMQATNLVCLPLYLSLSVGVTLLMKQHYVDLLYVDLLYVNLLYIDLPYADLLPAPPWIQFKMSLVGWCWRQPCINIHEIQSLNQHLNCVLPGYSRLCELTKQMVTATLQPSARDRRTFTFVWSAPRRERGSTSVTLCPGSWDITLFREYFDIFILISISHDKDFCPRFTHQRIWMSVKKKLGLYIQYNVSASSDECWTSDHSNTFLQVTGTISLFLYCVPVYTARNDVCLCQPE